MSEPRYYFPVPETIEWIRKRFPCSSNTTDEFCCLARSPMIDFDEFVLHCTRPKNHTGPHVAYGSEDPVLVWENLES